MRAFFISMQTIKQPIGILGGLGPKTTAEFYERLIERGTRISRPAVCIWSLPLHIGKEAAYISHGAHREYYFALLQDGALRLISAGCRQIVIPCNTVHEFHARLQRQLPVPVTNLIDIVADEVSTRGWNYVALLTTSRTRAAGLYQHALAKRKIRWVFPNADDQLHLDQLIRGLLGNAGGAAHQTFMSALVGKMHTNHIVLGCTDLQLLCAPSENIVDSLNVLANKTAEAIEKEEDPIGVLRVQKL